MTQVHLAATAPIAEPIDVPTARFPGHSRLSGAQERLVRCAAAAAGSRRGGFSDQAQRALTIARGAAGLIAGRGGEIAHLTAHVRAPTPARRRALVRALGRVFGRHGAPVCAVVEMGADPDDPGQLLEVEAFVRPAGQAGRGQPISTR